MARCKWYGLLKNNCDTDEKKVTPLSLNFKWQMWKGHCLNAGKGKCKGTLQHVIGSPFWHIKNSIDSLEGCSSVGLFVCADLSWRQFWLNKGEWCTWEWYVIVPLWYELQYLFCFTYSQLSVLQPPACPAWSDRIIRNTASVCLPIKKTLIASDHCPSNCAGEGADHSDNHRAHQIVSDHEQVHGTQNKC